MYTRSAAVILLVTISGENVLPEAGIEEIVHRRKKNVSSTNFWRQPFNRHF
jgi:hypothetical protein